MSQDACPFGLIVLKPIKHVLFQLMCSDSLLNHNSRYSHMYGCITEQNCVLSDVEFKGGKKWQLDDSVPGIM